MAEFGLPDEPEPLSETSLPNAAVLVRSLEYGPGLAPPDDDTGLPDVQVASRFPADYRVNLRGWFDDSKLVVDLLAIATRLPLLSRTVYVRLAKWIEEIGPNFAHGTQASRGFVSEAWPRRGRDLSTGDGDAFLKLAGGWHAYLDRPDAMNLAIRRLAASFSRPGGRFGQEDRVLDVAIALEVLYGGTTGHKLAQRAAALLGGSATEQKHRYDQAKGFYDLRSRTVHSKNAAYSRDVLGEKLEVGRNLACLTLMGLLDRGEPPEWADVMKGLLPETQAHIKRRGASGVSDLGVPIPRVASGATRGATARHINGTPAWRCLPPYRETAHRKVRSTVPVGPPDWTVDSTGLPRATSSASPPRRGLSSGMGIV